MIGRNTWSLPPSSLNLPLTAEVALEALERDALAGDRSAVQIERQDQVERRLRENQGQAFQREERFLGRGQDDEAIGVLADESPVREPVRTRFDAVSSGSDQQRI